MALWSTRTLVNNARNGGTSQTVNFTAATSGNLLVCVMGAAATLTTPTNWTRRNQALSGTELSVYTKTATAAESSFSTTMGGTNYTLGAIIYEFPSGSTWVNGVSAVSQTATAANPNLTGLTGTNLVFGAWCKAVTSTTTPTTATWTAPTIEDVDQGTVRAGSPITDGCSFGVGYQEDYTSSSFAPAITITTATNERLTFAVNVGSGAAAVIPTVVMSQPAWN